jgi:hypothetical protein
MALHAALNWMAGPAKSVAFASNRLGYQPFGLAASITNDDL